MNNLEKIVFLEMTNKQLTKFPNKEYYATIDLLTEEEDEQFTTLGNEIHRIWNYLNTKKSRKRDNFEVTSIQDYNEKINPVNDIILKVSSEFGITLKDGVSSELKSAILNILGKEFLDRFLEE